ncbi:MAB_1171c family putative transporter [Actinomadura atramentaria]|uniref:MAB_1171c family putative transporter n=1 Tax=Actinomadura atramentaria TaxID=1990 RepID=UPI000370CDA2|nr:MAB_1171c family putative transporter [Actinomadura atramentaria]
MTTAVVVVLWIVTAWRLPSIRQEQWTRGLGTTFAFLAVALTAALPAIDARISAATGIVALGTMIKHLAGIAACWSVLAWITSVLDADTARRRRAQVASAIATGVVTTVLFIASSPKPGPFDEVMAGDRLATAHVAVFEVYLGLAMGMATALFVAAARRTSAAILRTGLVLLSLGTTLGIGYAVLRCVVLITAIVDRTAPPTTVSHMAPDVEAAAILLIVGGTTLPAAATGLAHWRYYRALSALRPLWDRLTTAVPDVVLGRRPGRAADALPQDVRVRLLRRVVEIHDAQLSLRRHVTAEHIAWARAQLAQLGVAEPDLDAATTAAWLHAAAAAHLSGLPQLVDAVDDQPAGHDNLDQEAERLLAVAAMTRVPTVAQVAASLCQRVEEHSKEHR